MPRKVQTLKFKRKIFDDLGPWRKEMELFGYDVYNYSISTSWSLILVVHRDMGGGAFRSVYLSGMVSQDPRKKWKVRYMAHGEWNLPGDQWAAYSSLEDAVTGMGRWLSRGEIGSRGLVWKS